MSTTMGPDRGTEAYDPPWKIVAECIEIIGRVRIGVMPCPLASLRLACTRTDSLFASLQCTLCIAL